MHREAGLRVLRPFWSHPSLALPDLRFTHPTPTPAAPVTAESAWFIRAHIILARVQFLIVWPLSYFHFLCNSSILAWLVEPLWRRLRHGADHRIRTRPCSCRMVATKRRYLNIVLDAQTVCLLKDTCTYQHSNALCVRHSTKAFLPEIHPQRINRHSHPAAPKNNHLPSSYPRHISSV